MFSVLHILSSLNLGGAERITVELAGVQRSEGIDAQILSLGGEEEFLVEAVRNRQIPLNISDNTTSRFSRYLKLRSLFLKFDVIHVHSRGAFKFIAPVLPFSKGPRVIYTRHGLFPDDSNSFRILYSLMQPFTKYITFVTESGRDVFMANHNWKESKLAVVRNGVFVPRMLKAEIGNPIRFGSVGRMVSVKGQSKLLEAVALLKMRQASGLAPKRAFSLNFYGNGPLEDELRSQAAIIGGDEVTFHGEVSDIDQIYANIDVLVVASESEGLSMVIMEAMARGLPVIATDVGGNSTLVKSASTGLLVEERTPSAICDAMSLFLSESELILKYGQAAREMIDSEFSLFRTHEAYLECYRG